MTETDSRILSSIDIGRNALWNYVTLIIVLRRMKLIRGTFSFLPVFFGSLSSWQLLKEIKSTEANMLAAFCALLAGLIPLLYLASRVDDNIFNYTRLSGRYRVLEAKIKDYLFRFEGISAASKESLYQDILAEHLEIKRESHTAPRWAFQTAERLIERGDYIPVSKEIIDLHK